MGSFDSAGASLREALAPLRMTPCFEQDDSNQDEMRELGALLSLPRIDGRERYRLVIEWNSSN